MQPRSLLVCGARHNKYNKIISVSGLVLSLNRELEDFALHSFFVTHTYVRISQTHMRFYFYLKIEIKYKKK